MRIISKKIGRGLFLLFFILMAHNSSAEVELRKATFAGGCFWCLEQAFDGLDGVVEAVSGYTGGEKADPTYEEVCSGNTGHLEAVQVTYDPAKITYKQLLDVFWKHIDPTDGGGQFVDRGSQYKTAIFYNNDEQKRLAEESKKALEESAKFTAPVVTEIRESVEFYRAEDYHQNYYKTCPLKYKIYKSGSGREKYFKKMRGGDNDESDNKSAYSAAELKERLTPLQYEVTQESGTEPAFKNEYWDNKKEGIYVDIVSGEPLFSSLDKFDSGTGWPSFTKTLEPDNIVIKQDDSLSVPRAEVRSKNANSHLGHVFEDGPQPTGIRFCINSAALKFIPKENLEKEGYDGYKKLFGN